MTNILCLFIFFIQCIGQVLSLKWYVLIIGNHGLVVLVLKGLPIDFVGFPTLHGTCKRAIFWTNYNVGKVPDVVFRFARF